MKQYKKHTRENLGQKRTVRQTFTFHGPAYPKEISWQYTAAAYTEAVHCHEDSSITVSDH